MVKIKIITLLRTKPNNFGAVQKTPESKSALKPCGYWLKCLQKVAHEVYMYHLRPFLSTIARVYKRFNEIAIPEFFATSKQHWVLAI